jgi:hypothetical protein
MGAIGNEFVHIYTFIRTLPDVSLSFYNCALSTDEAKSKVTLNMGTMTRESAATRSPSLTSTSSDEEELYVDARTHDHDDQGSADDPQEFLDL